MTPISSTLPTPRDILAVLTGGPGDGDVREITVSEDIDFRDYVCIVVLFGRHTRRDERLVMYRSVGPWMGQTVLEFRMWARLISDGLATEGEARENTKR